MRKLENRYADCKIVGLELVRMTVEELGVDEYGWTFTDSSTSGSGIYRGPRIAEAFGAAEEAARAAAAGPSLPKYSKLIVSPLRTGEAIVFGLAGTSRGKVTASEYAEVGKFPSRAAAWKFVEENRA